MQRSRLGFGFGCTLAAAALCPTLSARPAEAPASYDGQAETRTPLHFVADRTPDFCAAHGRGFVRLQGTDTCIKIGGHVRVDTTISSRSQIEWGSAHFGPVPDDDETIPSHLRVDDNLDAASFR
jgi:hypothetical protein